MKYSAKFLGLLAAGVCSLTLMSAISRADETPAPSDPAQTPTYQDVVSIIADNCQTCHTGGESALGGVSLDTEAEVKANAAQAYAAIDAGLMPYGDSEWHTSPDGVKLLAYLKSQIPDTTQPTPEPNPAPTPAN